MNFVKLTDSNTSTLIYVNIEAIFAFYKFGDRGTTIELKSDESYRVSEEPEEILEMIENTINKNNNKH